MEQEAGGFLASTVADFSISLYDHGTIHAVGGWAYGDTDTKLPYAKIPDELVQLPAVTGASAGQVLGLASDKSLEWRDTRRAVAAYANYLQTEGTRDNPTRFQGPEPYVNEPFKNGVTWEPDDIMELRLSVLGQVRTDNVQNAFPHVRISGVDHTVFAPWGTAIFDFGVPRVTGSGSSAGVALPAVNTDVVSVQAGIWNYWLSKTSGENPGVPVGNAVFPRWKRAVYGRIDRMSYMFADVNIYINPINKSRFYYDVFWTGQYNPPAGGTAELDGLYKPGQIYLEIILHKKN